MATKLSVIKKVCSKLVTTGSDIEVADTAHALVEFKNGSIGHLDLTIAVRMDWHEGFQIYGEHGSVLGKTFNPWLYKTSEVDIFKEKET